MSKVSAISKKALKHLSLISDDFGDFTRKAKTTPDKGKPILISGAPRSGTTWLGEMLNSNSVRVFHEPFGELTILWNWSLAPITLDPCNLDAFRKIDSDIRRSRYWRAYWKHQTDNPNLSVFAPHRYTNFVSGRAIIEDPMVCYFLEDINREYDYEFILLYRNPLSIVSSLKRLGWDPSKRLEIIFSHPYFADLRSELSAILPTNLNKLEVTQKMALQTSLLHYRMNKFAQTASPIVLRYEDIVDNPNSLINNVFEPLGLTFNEGTQYQFQRLTRSPKEIKDRHQVERNSRSYRNIWRTRLTEQEIEEINSIYESVNGPYL